MRERGAGEVSRLSGFILLSSEQMRSAEAAAIGAGVSEAALMEAAGRGVADIAMKAWSKRPAAVICGPGNNGGDGFVVARLLADAGWTVRVGLLGEKGALKAGAKLMADLYEGDIEPMTPGLLAGAELIIDALFGTGLSRPLEGLAKEIIDTVNKHPAPVLAVDIPSGVDADTGLIQGSGAQAARTVAFFQKKPGHALFPGRALCGVVDTVDIGITPEHVAKLRPTFFENHPGLWGRYFSRPSPMEHKYHRGSVLAVTGGAHQTGAGRLAARSALRIGAGLVTVLSPREALGANAAHLTSIMLQQADTAGDMSKSLQGAEKYSMVAVIGPAAGVGHETRQKTLAVLRSKAGAVLDADALTSFADDGSALFSALREDDILTPHMGEFARLFSDVDLGVGKLEAARQASIRAGAVIVLKGADTIIAAPGGWTAVNVNAPPELAKAGTGDVLAGFIAGLRAQGMPAFEAACAGVWFHGAAGQAVGPGLIAEDLPEAIPAVLRTLQASPEGSGPVENQGVEET